MPDWVQPALARWMAVMAGAVVAWLPSTGPFVALIALLGGRRHLRGRDALWWLAAFSLGVPWLVSGHAAEAGLTVVQVLAAWLLFRAAEGARPLMKDERLLRDVGTGLILGLVGVTLGGIARIEIVDFEALYRFTQVIAWREHPTLFAHTVLTLSLLVAITVDGPRRRGLALGIGAVGVLVTGALEAVIAWVLVAAVLAASQPTRTARLAHAALVAAVVVTVAGAGSVLGLGRTGFLVDLERDPSWPNLLQGTEVPTGDWWHALGVAVSVSTARLDGADRVAYTVVKQDDRSWSRLQQMARLDPGTSTVSVYLRPEQGTRPGIDLWGRVGMDEEPQEFNAHATLRDGALVSSVRGPIEVRDARILELDPNASDPGWVRIALTVAHEGASQAWYVGVTPNRVTSPDGRATFAGLQVERGDEAGPYVPAPSRRGLDLRTARVHVWSDAVQAIRASAWFGWGPSGMARSLQTLRPWEVEQRPLPAHAHNAFLDAWLERGPLGLAGIVLLFLALASSALRRRDGVVLAVIAAVVLINLFDSTLLYGGVLYPLAALLGWSSGAHRLASRPYAATHVSGVRLGLAIGDLAAAWAGLAVSLVLGAWLDARPGWGAEWLAPQGVLLYGLVLWPLFMLREGLHPGYGTSPPNELRRTVRAGATAGGIMILATRLFPDALGVPIANAIVWATTTTLLLPMARGLTKRLLLALGAWGRPVVVIGAGAAVLRVTRALQRRRLDGLHPVGVFSDDPTVGEPTPDGGRAVAGVPLRGGVADAVRYARSERVQHAIVASPEADPASLQALIEDLTRAFPRVQFLPDLATLPSHGVIATDLDHLLALELRVGLLDAGNRAVKRALDLAMVAVAGLVAVPLMLLLALAIRADSPGAAFFWQERIGRGGRRFRMLKFRTMVHDADAVLTELLARDPSARDEWLRRQKLERDPRVTRVGRWLRRSSLDELPQVWNVLRGEMSLVGPRPIVEAEVAHYGRDFEAFAAVPPGITGYWQVSGRSRVAYPERVEYDTYYVRNWSIWLDLVILARTVGVVLRREGAF